jgi:hypothetical protein
MEPTNNIHGNGNGQDSKLKETFGKKMPYEVPDGYFENLPERTLESIRQTPERSLLLQRGFRYFAAAAAVFIMAALVITMVFSEKDSQENNLEEYSLSDIYRYNIDNLADLEEAYLLSLIEDDSLSMTGFFEIETESISDEVIMEYLLAENYIEYHIINEY